VVGGIPAVQVHSRSMQNTERREKRKGEDADVSKDGCAGLLTSSLELVARNGYRTTVMLASCNK
jgi:hypothetical protein